MAFSLDGARLLSAGSQSQYDQEGSGHFSLWDAATGQLIRSFRTPYDSSLSNSIASAALSPDGTRLALGSEDKTVTLWDTATGRLVRTFEGHSERITSVAFSPDGSSIASGADELKLWETSTGQLIHTLQGSRPRSIAFSPDGRSLLTDGGRAKIWMSPVADCYTALVKISMLSRSCPTESI